MIKVIVFDLGGVLFSEGKLVAVGKLKKEFGYNQQVVLRILTSPESLNLRRGLLSDQQFWSWAQRQLPKRYNVALIKKKWYESYILDTKVMDLIKQLKQRYKIIAFSGNIKSRITYLDRKYGFRKLFDEEIYSFKYHLEKRDGDKLAKIMIEAAGVMPEEIVYIDDREEDTASARKLGVNVLIYSAGIDHLKKQLRKLGVR